ncbi:hypothetical protein [Alkalicoccobacillus porphyridii]|uniref:Uncharacterized protein n=1 Tax=Alkalicoccobacillus porphyridii TaxID=2597270 RepID=A0A554A191_9BACI|nr:hypothetical protein [Alkalicoccobacillus porphyridii]TSB47453.1 hypothetical protein FN960_06880 [Alkalicoccobacillus porphyridii]
MHYGEAAIRTFYLGIFIFLALGFLFILLPFFFKKAQQSIKLISLTVGSLIMILAIAIFLNSNRYGVLKLFF